MIDLLDIRIYPNMGCISFSHSKFKVTITIIWSSVTLPASKTLYA
jgi:hypothetical protein